MFAARPPPSSGIRTKQPIRGSPPPTDTFFDSASPADRRQRTSRRGSRLAAAHFVVTPDDKKTCPLAPPRHGGARSEATRKDTNNAQTRDGLGGDQLRNVAVVLAGGTGTRVGLNIPKQLIKIAGKPIIEHTIAAMHRSPLVDEIIVMMAPGYLDDISRDRQERRLRQGQADPRGRRHAQRDDGGCACRAGG